MTSIEWLIEKMLDKGIGIPKEWREQAKEMHKQEIIDAYDKGEFDCGCNGTGEDYYNKIFKKD